MESFLYQWYLNMKDKKIEITAKMVKQKALALTKYKDFVASKGWLEKFKKKYQLDLVKEKKNKVKSNIVFNTQKLTPQERKKDIEITKNKIEK